MREKCDVLYDNYRVLTSSWGWGSSVDHTRNAGMWFLFLWLVQQIESYKDSFTILLAYEVKLLCKADFLGRIYSLLPTVYI